MMPEAANEDRMLSHIRPDRPNRISLVNLRKQLHLMNLSIKLVKIKGHSGIKGTQMADQQAKDRAFNMLI